MNLRFYSQGTDVMLLQATLAKLGYYTGDVDGLYGFETFSAVKKFQSDNSLTPDGIVGPKTYAALEPYIYGFTYHTIKQGDTLYKIAVQYNSTIKSIQIANPAVKADNLQVGAEIIVPFNYDVVDTNINYTYKILQIDVSGLTARYPFLEVFTVGKSVLGRDLIGLKLGIGEKKVFYAAAHHSLEWITSVVMMKFVEDYADAYANGKTLSGFDIRKLFTEVSIYIVPMVNPDGIELVLNGLSPSNPNYNNLIKYNNGSTDFSKNWEANNNGVDLNHNYDASWEEAKQASAALGITSPGPTRWGGDYPFSEPETKGVSSYVDTSNFQLVLSYNSHGEVIFYNYLNIDVP
ncbi:MAG: LysM peptidoglycan-binding domain-containing protein, partial [Eubacteriaceae bacterium]|nr:LysM peptidoglycan-binding domain-containing protein [Eubacteriaceae bacterium]